MGVPLRELAIVTFVTAAAVGCEGQVIAPPVVATPKNIPPILNKALPSATIPSVNETVVPPEKSEKKVEKSLLTPPGNPHIGMVNAYFLPGEYKNITSRIPIQFKDALDSKGVFDTSRVAKMDFYGRIDEIKRSTAELAKQGIPTYVVIDMGIDGEVSKTSQEEFRQFAQAVSSLLPDPGIYFIFGNEENLPGSIYRNPKEIDRYVNYYKAGIEGILASNPNANVMTFGDAYFDGYDGNQFADVLAPVLRKLKENNIRVDSVGFHFHDSDVTRFKSRALKYRQLLDSLGLAHIPLVASEVGLPTGWKDYPEAKKSTWATAIVAEGAAMQEEGLISDMLIYSAAELSPLYSFTKNVNGNIMPTPSLDAFFFARRMFTRNIRNEGIDTQGVVHYSAEADDGHAIEFAYNTGKNPIFIVRDNVVFTDVYGNVVVQPKLNQDDAVYIHFRK